MPTPGRLEAIWIKRMKRGPMDPAGEAELETAQGLRGNANRGGKRQVTIIEAEVFEALKAELGDAVEPIMRRANLLVRGCRLEKSEGKTLRIGACSILLWGETRPCNLMEETLPGLRDALDPPWRGGAYGEVIDGGTIRVGDTVTLEAHASPD